MDLSILIVVATIIVMTIFIAYFLNLRISRLIKEGEGNSDQKMMLEIINNLRQEIADSTGKNRQELEQKLEIIRRTLDRGMDYSSKTIQEQFKESRNLIEKTARKITQFEETNKRIEGFATQLQSLENILKNPKQRGVLGEYYLETMLKNVFEPSQFQMQYKFRDGDIVDAVIFYQKKVLPIDSKFSMENYNRLIEEDAPEKKDKLSKKLIGDLKKRIEETSKYIKIRENTFDFACMFIPSESVYYDLLQSKIGAIRETQDNLIEFAQKKNVIIVSPSSFYAYLQTILHGLKLIKMKESMSEFKKNVDKLDKHLKNFETHYLKVGTHLTTTVSAYNNSSNEFNKIDKDIYKITDNKELKSRKKLLIEKPEEFV